VNNDTRKGAAPSGAVRYPHFNACKSGGKEEITTVEGKARVVGPPGLSRLPRCSSTSFLGSRLGPYLRAFF